MSAMGRLVWWHNFAAPYMIDRWNALAAGSRYDVEIWFDLKQRPGNHRDVLEGEWGFPHREVGTSAKGVASALRSLTSDPPAVLMARYASPPSAAALRLMRGRSTAAATLVEATWPHLRSSTPVRRAIRKYVMGGLDGVLTVGPDATRYAREIGASAGAIAQIPHFSGFAAWSEAAARARPERDSLRRRLGLEGVTFIYSGRLLAQKGVHELLSAFVIVCSELDGPASLLLVGDGPEHGALRAYIDANGLRTVKIIADAVGVESLAAYYSAADIFVFPTKGDTYGQVIDEAMSCGLPVLTTPLVHELEGRVVHGESGLVAAGAGPRQLADVMIALARETPSRWQAMGAAGRAGREGGTPEGWADAVAEAIDEMLRRSTSTRR